MSIPAGLVNWKELMRSIAAEIGLDVEKESDLVAVAQYHLNERGGRQRINQTLVSEFSGRGKATENHRILARLPIETFWTTNYDHLIEDALREIGKRPDVKITGENLATTLPRREAIVYKMHGDVSDPANAIVSKDDYESYSASRRGQLFSTALRGDLVSKTFLCLGPLTGEASDRQKPSESSLSQEGGPIRAFTVPTLLRSYFEAIVPGVGGGKALLGMTRAQVTAADTRQGMQGGGHVRRGRPRGAA